MDLTFLLLGFALVALLYAGVGHGGASGYLAVMTLLSYPMADARPDALVLNIAVSGIAFRQFYRAGHFYLRDFLWLAAFSVPAAFAGGLMVLEDSIYKKLLGGMLLAGTSLMVFKPSQSADIRRMPAVAAAFVGLLIGLVSGLTGIGGGILLSPLMILAGWAGQKQAAALSSAFIFVNSISGFLGWLKTGKTLDSQLPWMLAVVLVFGLLGAYLGANRYQSKGLKWLLIIVLIIASVKLLLV
jgi:uncharacterized membrane protein YfcA